MKASRSISVLAIVISMLSVVVIGQAANNVEPETQKTFTISGNVGISGVVLNGLPGAPRSDQFGHYSTKVPAGFSGRVVPFKEGCIFSPKARGYNQVNEDYLAENYASRIQMHVITGAVIPKLSGVLMQGFPMLPITNENGIYRTQVEYGWSGTVTPVKEGYHFNPPSRTYENVDDLMENQDYGREDVREDLFLDEAPMETPPSYTEPIVGPTLGSGSRPDVLVIPTGNAVSGEFSVVQEDMRVMNHILRSALEENRPNLVGGVFTDYGTFFGRTGVAFDGLYIQGYGAIFFVESDMPLTLSRTFLNTTESDKTEQDDNIDPVWREARQQVLSPNRRGSRRDNRVQADPDEMLKKLITSLKHATNMHIEANEKIIVTILSQGSSGMVGYGSMGELYGGGGMNDNRSSGLYGPGGLDRSRGQEPYGGVGRGGAAESDQSVEPFQRSRAMARAGAGYGPPGRGDRMRLERPASRVTIQVKKEIVDAFARGEIPPDIFRQSVDVFKY